ncbi:MAG: ATP-binding protein [Bacteroidota bacterium]
MSPSVRQRFAGFFEHLGKYRFEIRHLTVLLLVLIGFQIIVLFLNQRSLRGVFDSSQQWYKQDAAERIANLTATSFELLLESHPTRERITDVRAGQIVQEFNIIFSQQLLDKNVQSVCILIPDGDGVVTLDDGQQLFDRFYGGRPGKEGGSQEHAEALRLYRDVEPRLRGLEQTTTVVDEHGAFHVFVPFVPQGEFAGAVYMKSAPDLSFLTTALNVSNDETALVYAGLIIVGFLGMYYISTRTLRERNNAQHALFEQQKRHLSDEIHHQKEMVFAKRIYHAHHKAEKIGGFIKEDLRLMTPDNMQDIRHRIGKYASFVARVIYDMKWYDPPLQTVRGPMFRTDINDVLRFIVDHIFRRVSNTGEAFHFDLDLDPSLPPVAVNEYVLWEIIEPILQNSLDHAGVPRVTLRERTEHDPARHRSRILVEDNGVGIRPELLTTVANGIQRLFQEHKSGDAGDTKHHSGYGCFIAHEIATQRLGWTLTAENLLGGGCRFTFLLSH